MQQNMFYYNQNEDIDEDLNIDLKKILMILLSHKKDILKVFTVVFLFFVALTFIIPKKYKVDADIYVHKSNNTNLVEINPFALEEIGAGGGLASALSGGNAGNLSNELEIILSPLIMDKVVKENNIVYKKKWGIIPNKKEGEYVPGYLFAKSKALKIEGKKGTNVITITYKAKKPEFAYNIVCSIITNYIEVSKHLHSEKAKNDTKIIESEYNKAKEDLNTKINSLSGLAQTASTGVGNLAAMSAFSKTARQAISSMQGQFTAGTKSQIALQEETAKMTQLATKLQWVKMVEEMSESSKVLVLKEPVLLKDFEYSSPKLLINIILGIIFGVIASFIFVIFSEITSKKLSYSTLTENIIYNDQNLYFNLKKLLLNYKNKSITCVAFDAPDAKVSAILSEFDNITALNADISDTLISNIEKSDYVILMSKIGKTDKNLYNSIKESVQIQNKKILSDVLI